MGSSPDLGIVAEAIPFVTPDPGPSSFPFARDVRPSRILYISYSSPLPARLGPARRHYHLLEQLSRFYEVHVLSLGERGDAPAVERHFGPRVVGLTFAEKRGGWSRTRVLKLSRTLAGRCDFLPVHEPDLRRQCERLTAACDFEAIVLSSVLLRGLPLPVNACIVGDTHNVEFDVLRRTAALADGWLLRQYARLQWPATRLEERRCGHDVDVMLATSPRDRRVFEEELGLRQVEVIPNGVDLGEFSPGGKPAPSPTILFSGLMSYYPNQQGIRWFINDVLPRVLRRVPGARLVVAGAAPPRWLRLLAGDRLEVTGYVPDIRPYIERASIVIAPLMIGGGTRVKILEAQAMARPVVSTTLGAEGLDLEHGISAMIADDAAAFAAQVVRLLTDAEYASCVAQNGRAHVARYFDWNRIGENASRRLAARLGLTSRRVPGWRVGSIAGLQASGS